MRAPDGIDRRIDELLDELIELCGSKNALKRRVKAHKAKHKPVGKRGPSYKWARDSWLVRHGRHLSRAETIALLARLAAEERELRNKRPKGSKDPIFLRDSLIHYSRMRGMSPDRLARAFVDVLQMVDPPKQKGGAPSFLKSRG